MNPENSEATVSSGDWSVCISSSSDEVDLNYLNLENEQCTCSLNGRKFCVKCKVKQYQEAQKAFKNYSQKFLHKRKRKLTKLEKQNANIRRLLNYNKDFQQNQNCDKEIQGEHGNTNMQATRKFETDLELTQDYYTDLRLSQSNSKDLQLDCVNLLQSQIHHKDLQQHKTNNTDLQQIQNYTDLEQNKNLPTDIQKNLNCHTDLPKIPNYYKDLQQSENLPTDLQMCQNYPADLQRIQNSHTDAQQVQNSHIDLQSHSLADLQKLPNCNENLQQRQKCDVDLRQVRDCSTDLQEEDKLYIKREAFEMDSDSSFPVSENTKDSEPSCDNLEHSSEKCDLNHSSGRIMANIKREAPDADICTNSSNQDSKRIRRSSKRKRDLEDYCPVCGLTVRVCELESHFAKEVENLTNISKTIRKPRLRSQVKEGVKVTYVQVKCNRENRLAAKVAKYSKKDRVQCPVCKLRLTGSEVEVNEHVLSCMREDDDDSDINVTDRSDNFEEYEIGGETRVRAISFVPGGYKSLHGQSSTSRPSDDDDDIDLNVDVDDTLTYGKAQYTELDVIHNMNSATEVKELEQLRRAVISDTAVEPHLIEGNKWSQNCEIANEIAIINGSIIESTSKSSTDEKKDTKDEEPFQMAESNIISCLKAKLKDLEQEKNVKCLICLEPYTKPVVATTCWHVHCEECWLVSMGVKKLCPQCNTIVFPSNLRRIYL